MPFAFLGGVLLLFWFITDQVISARCGECYAKNGKRKVFCVNCGANLTKQSAFSESAIFDRKTLLFSFFIPLIGIYMFFSFRDVYPDRTRYIWVSGLGGLTIIILNLVAGFFFYIGYGSYFYYF